MIKTYDIAKTTSADTCCKASPPGIGSPTSVATQISATIVGQIGVISQLRDMLYRVRGDYQGLQSGNNPDVQSPPESLISLAETTTLNSNEIAALISEITLYI